MELIQKNINKVQIEKLLQSLEGVENSRVSFSSYIGVEKVDDLVVLKLDTKGLIDNMQTEPAAFESWALIVRAAFASKGAFVKVRIDGEKPEQLTDKEEMHYNRFLYRISKFVEVFEWAYTDDFEREIAIFKDAHRNMVLNVPKSEAKVEAAKGEATMERYFCEDNKYLYDEGCLNHQLPVRIFDDEVKEVKAITARGFIDAWAIKGETFYVFELKLDNNRSVGAISELMFYVNVIHDLMAHKINILSNSKHRSFDKIKALYDSGKCREIVGRIIARQYHPLLALTNKTIAEAFDKYDSAIHIKIETDINSYIDNYRLRQDIAMSKEFLEEKKREQANILKEYRASLFENATDIGYSKKNNEWFDYMLKPQYGDKNLYQGIRKEAIEYFKKYGITWWQCINKPDEPTSHMVSSQINCLNHLFAFRDKPEALKLILQKATLLPIKSILTSPIDEDGYIAFEFVYKNMSLMCDNTGKYHENYESRGTRCTSIDALVYAQLEDNRKVLIPIEWKYTETYDGIEAMPSSWKRYPDLVRLEDCNLKKVYDLYRADPFYELMRQTLLVEQIIRHKDCGIEADGYFHIMVIPNEHTELKSAIESNYIPTLKDQSKFRIIDPQELLSPIAENKNFENLITYLQTRYWKK